MQQNDRPKIYIAVHLALRQNDDVLLLRREGSGYHDGDYAVPAGHLEYGETAQEAMIREAKEEIGITLIPKQCDVMYVQHRYRFDREYVDFYIQTKKWKGKIRNMEPKKCSDLSWFPINNLPSNIIPVVAHALRNIQNGIAFDDIGKEL